MLNRMAFVPVSSFTPVWTFSRTCSLTPLTTNTNNSHRVPATTTSRKARRACPLTMQIESETGSEETSLESEMKFKLGSAGMTINDAMDFFRYREGTWASWRVTHHLAFRRSESGESQISMKCLEKTDERIVDLCKQWDVEPELAQGGCYVTWKATLDWDEEGENHEGETVFAIVPDEGDIRSGRMLRDRGYAEIIPIVGTYYLDESNDLNLETPYEGGAVIEKFSFDTPDIVNRLSTVKRFGGLSTATFANEQRTSKIGEEKENEQDSQNENDEDEDDIDLDDNELFQIMEENSFMNMLHAAVGDEPEVTKEPDAANIRTSRWGTPLSSMTEPPASSAFSSGFATNKSKSTKSSASTTSSQTKLDGDTNVSSAIEELAAKAGVDLSKIPPSMREDFLASFQEESGKDSGGGR